LWGSHRAQKGVVLVFSAILGEKKNIATKISDMACSLASYYYSKRSSSLAIKRAIIYGGSNIGVLRDSHYLFFNAI
jgi:hypothetical protein